MTRTFAPLALASALLLPAVAGAQQAISLAPLPGVLHLWPWMAVGGIVAILAVISLATQRRTPFGNLL